MLFKDIVGNEKNKKSLQGILEPSHAYMFLGIEGIGKLIFAKEFSKKWLCNSLNKPCGTCKACLQCENNNNPDLEIIDTEENSIKVDQIRKMIDKVLEKPIVSEKKIYIINNADKMTSAAQNCLLKILEEPPAYVIIILIGINEHFFLNTIKSRCIKINFGKITDEEMRKYLQKSGENIEVSDTMLKIYDGSIRKALSLKGQEQKYEKLEKIIDSLERVTKVEAIKQSNMLTEDKENIKDVLEYINILLYSKGKHNVKYLVGIEIVNKTLRKMKMNCNTEMIIDNMLIELWEVINEKYSRG